MPFCWSWPAGWKRVDNRIRRHWFWNGGLKHRLHTSTRVSLLVFSCLDYWILQIYQGRAQNRRTYTPQRWCLGLTMVLNSGQLKVFLIKNLCVYLFMVKQCIYLVIHMCFMQIYFHLLWCGNISTEFVVFLNFLLTLHATWAVKESEILRRFKESSKTQFEGKRRKRINVTIFVRYYLSRRPKVFCKKDVLRN